MSAWARFLQRTSLIMRPGNWFRENSTGCPSRARIRCHPGRSSKRPRAASVAQCGRARTPSVRDWAPRFLSLPAELAGPQRCKQSLFFHRAGRRAGGGARISRRRPVPRLVKRSRSRRRACRCVFRSRQSLLRRAPTRGRPRHLQISAARRLANCAASSCRWPTRRSIDSRRSTLSSNSNGCPAATVSPAATLTWRIAAGHLDVDRSGLRAVAHAAKQVT